MPPPLLSATQLRLRFARALSRMYQQEVPQYRTLQQLVDRVHEENNVKGLPLADLPRHGAVRLACLEELRVTARFLNVMEMRPVGYYDMFASAGLPIHATAFRPVLSSLAEQDAAPFRLFVSVLRPELLPPALQPLARRLLGRRAPVFNSRTMALVARAESQAGVGGLTDPEAEELVRGGCETLAWRNQVDLTRDEYDTLRCTDAKAGDLLVDILAFRNPHLNHLTPATVHIDAVQQRMRPDAGLAPKDRVEGPPGGRKCNVLLRQTSFLAVDEGIVFTDGLDDLAKGSVPQDTRPRGSHRARFGEVEQRGAALTPKGRRKYDAVVAEARRRCLLTKDRDAAFKALFDDAFPDDWEALRAQGLVWAAYRLTPKGLVRAAQAESGQEEEKATTKTRTITWQQAVEEGLVAWEPIRYEDFLPLSAAGIFQSNLHRPPSGHDSMQQVREHVAPTLFDGHTEEVGESKGQLASVLGADGVLDEMKLYEAQQEASLAEVKKRLRIPKSP